MELETKPTLIDVNGNESLECEKNESDVLIALQEDSHRLDIYLTQEQAEGLLAQLNQVVYNNQVNIEANV